MKAPPIIANYRERGHSLLRPLFASWGATAAAIALDATTFDGIMETIKALAFLAALATSAVVITRQIGILRRERHAASVAELVRAARMKCPLAITGECPMAVELEAELDKLERRKV